MCEWREFVTSIRENREPMGNGRDGLEALKLVLVIYESVRRGCVADLQHFGLEVVPGKGNSVE